MTLAALLAQRAAARRARTVRLELQRGIPSLATIAATAAFWGLAGTCLGIVNSFTGCGGSKSICLAAVVERLAASFLTNAWGLLIAITALAAHSILNNQLERCEAEMALAISRLPDSLS